MEKIQKLIYKKEKYHFENFNKLMNWAIKALNKLIEKPYQEQVDCEKCGGELGSKTIEDETFDYCEDCKWLTN